MLLGDRVINVSEWTRHGCAFSRPEYDPSGCRGAEWTAGNCHTHLLPVTSCYRNSTGAAGARFLV